MSCFKFWDFLYRRIMSTTNNFWWKNKKEGEVIHRGSSNLILKSKECPNTLMSRLFQANYDKASCFLNAPLGSRPFMWRSIWVKE